VSFQCPPDLVEQEVIRLNFLELPFATWPLQKPLLPCQSLISGYSSGDDSHTHRLGDSTWFSHNPRPWGRLQFGSDSDSTSESSTDFDFYPLWLDSQFLGSLVAMDTFGSDADDELEEDD
jgi:hypothetical protein